MPIGKIASALSGAGAIAGLFGGDEKTREAAPSGYQSLFNIPNPEFQEFVKQTVPNAVMAAHNAPRARLPFMRVDMTDTSPFAPKGLQAFQAFMDEKAKQAPAPAPEEDTGATNAMMRGLMIQQLANQANVARGNMSGAMPMLSLKDLQELGGLESGLDGIQMGDAQRLLGTFIGNRMRGGK